MRDLALVGRKQSAFLERNRCNSNMKESFRRILPPSWSAEGSKAELLWPACGKGSDKSKIRIKVFAQVIIVLGQQNLYIFKENL
jgi:hypothetical protein